MKPLVVAPSRGGEQTNHLLAASTPEEWSETLPHLEFRRCAEAEVAGVRRLRVLKAAGWAELHIYQRLSGGDDLCHT